MVMVAPFKLYFCFCNFAPCRQLWSIIFMSGIFMSGIFMSSIFMSCNFMSSIFMSGIFMPAISCPAFSCPAILMVRHFHVQHFQSTRLSVCLWLWVCEVLLPSRGLRLRSQTFNHHHHHHHHQFIISSEMQQSDVDAMWRRCKFIQTYFHHCRQHRGSRRHRTAPSTADPSLNCNRQTDRQTDRLQRISTSITYNLAVCRTQHSTERADSKCKQKSCAVAKMTARCALCMGALKIFGSPWLRPRRLFREFSMGFCSDWAYKCACKIWIS